MHKINSIYKTMTENLQSEIASFEILETIALNKSANLS